MPRVKKKFIKGYHWRRLSQIICLTGFLFLFIKTDYSGSDEIAYAVNILFRLDPLLAACASLAAGALIILMWPALITVFLTLIFGRFFCGWCCPMGVLLDLTQRIFPRQTPGSGKDFQRLKFYLLAFLLIGALFGLPAAGYFDPFSILVRGLALAVQPAFNVLNTTFFTYTYQNAPDWINAVTEPVYSILKSTVLPFDQKYHDLALLSIFILLAVFLMEYLQRRFFCRNVCPLGGLLAVLAKFSLLRGKAGTKCGKCTTCRDVCRMDAIDQEKNISKLDCNLCLDCVALCPGSKISFTFSGPLPQAARFDVSRRHLIASLAAGAVLPFFLRTRSMALLPSPSLIRPPGALSEPEFLGRCVRCGECMKVCIGNGLQPSFLEAGIEGMFSPRLNARVGYCELNCTLCGQVCPTGAIEKITIKQKHAEKIGHAFFDKNLCLPYAKGISCLVCEEHCPTPQKAIQFRKVEVSNIKGEKVMVLQPYIVDNLCVGCGICETKCPLPGAAAVRVTSAGESRNPDNAIPLLPSYGD